MTKDEKINMLRDALKEANSMLEYFDKDVMRLHGNNRLQAKISRALLCTQ